MTGRPDPEILDPRTRTGRTRSGAPGDIAELEASEARFEASGSTNRAERTTTVLDMLAVVSASAHNPLLHALDSYLNHLLIEFQMLVHGDRPPPTSGGRGARASTPTCGRTTPTPTSA